MNTLYYGDNLDVLRQHVPNESVDLVYLDPPFNSAQDYNVLFAEKDGTTAVVLGVPVEECPSCSQIWLTMETAIQLDAIFNRLDVPVKHGGVSL